MGRGIPSLSPTTEEILNICSGAIKVFWAKIFIAELAVPTVKFNVLILTFNWLEISLFCFQSHVLGCNIVFWG